MVASSTTANAVNSTPETACAWIESKVKSHELSPNTGRLWTTAIRALIAMRREDEVGSTESFLELLPELERRWCIAHDDARGETGKTYSSRAKGGCRAHLGFLEDPSGFRFNSRPAASAPKKKVEKKPEAEPAQEHTTAEQQAAAKLETIPIAGKGEFKFVRPTGLMRADVMKIAWGLWMFCDDFDPSMWNPGSPGTPGIVPSGQ